MKVFFGFQFCFNKVEKGNCYVALHYINIVLAQWFCTEMLFLMNISFYRLVEFNNADMEAEDQVVAGDAVISDDEEVTLI